MSFFTASSPSKIGYDIVETQNSEHDLVKDDIKFIQFFMTHQSCESFGRLRRKARRNRAPARQ
jgi:phosphopantetheinyl transferase (holo-ACP synthase)